MVFSVNPERKGGTVNKNISRISKRTLKSLKKELKSYEEEGISLYLNGCPSTTKSIVKAHMIAEDGVYMRDYVGNGKGGIERLDFQFVKER